MAPSVRYLLAHMPTVAEQLREAREAMRLDIRQVADTTKLKVDQIHALESGDYESFTAPVYLRGSLRTYAALLKLDAVELIAQLEAEQGGQRRAEAALEQTNTRKGTVDSVMLRLSRINWLIVGSLILLVVIGLVINFSYRAWKTRRAIDPLRALTSGVYQPPAESGELLPLPTNAPFRRP